MNQVNIEYEVSDEPRRGEIFLLQDETTAMLIEIIGKWYLIRLIDGSIAGMGLTKAGVLSEGDASRLVAGTEIRLIVNIREG